MDEIMRDFLGLEKMTNAERENKAKDLLGKIEVDHVISDGKVYIGIDQLSRILETFSGLMGMRGVALRDLSSVFAAQGIDIIREVLGELNEELLGRKVKEMLGDI